MENLRFPTCMVLERNESLSSKYSSSFTIFTCKIQKLSSTSGIGEMLSQPTFRKSHQKLLLNVIFSISIAASVHCRLKVSFKHHFELSKSQ